MTIFNVRYTTNGINVYNYDYYYDHLFMGYSKREIENDHRTFNSCSKKFMFKQLLRYYKKGLNNWIELYNNDRFKNKREKKRMNYYINKLKEFESMVQE